MTSLLTVHDALSLLNKSSLPTVITEGSDDYRVMRKIENRLSDIGVDFLPLGGRGMVLDVWERLPPPRHANTVALVDLDLWLYTEIPTRYTGDNILYTNGYSIENDILLDYDLLSLLDAAEMATFAAELSIVCAEHARQIEAAKTGHNYFLKRHASDILAAGDVTATLSVPEVALKQILEIQFRQAVRGKTVFQLLVRQLSRAGRFAKFGYKQLYEIGSSNIGGIFEALEGELRVRLS